MKIHKIQSSEIRSSRDPNKAFGSEVVSIGDSPDEGTSEGGYDEFQGL